MKKTIILNILLLLVSLTLSLFIVEIFARFHFKSLALPNIEQIDNWTKAMSYNHHVRPWDYPGAKENPTKYIFSEYPINKNSIVDVLIQGDSWVELLDRQGDLSEKLIVNQANVRNLYNGGTSSYSPSTMLLQLREMRVKYNINPKLIIAHVDQTDVGDECFRYKDLLIHDHSGKVIAIKKNEPSDQSAYTVSYETDNLRYNENEKYKSLALVVNFFYHRYYLKKIGENYGLQKAPWKDICSYLVAPNKTPAFCGEYFKKTLQAYIDEVFSSSSVQKLVIITHPHLRHFSKNIDHKYSGNVSILVSSVAERNKNCEHINMMDIFKNVYENKDPTDVFRPEDPWSHLLTEIVKNYYSKFIAKIIKQNVAEMQ